MSFQTILISLNMLKKDYKMPIKSGVQQIIAAANLTLLRQTGKYIGQ